MKIKQDFVTNSSSVSYVVFVPKELTFTDEEFLYYVENEHWDNVFDEEIPDAKKQARNILRDLSYNNQVFLENCDFLSYGFVYFFLYDKGLVLGEIENPFDGGSMVGTSKQCVENAFMAIHGDEIRKICNVEVKK